MGDTIFLTGDFSSGSTLLFTLFRAADPDYYCLYEPLHERLLEYLYWPLRPSDRHFGVDQYYTEFKGFTHTRDLFDPAWGNSGLHVDEHADAPELYRYLSYLIGTAHGRRPVAVLKENRFTFRIAWMRRQFPRAKVVHVQRERDSQWNSVVRRVQTHLGREDVGQDRVDFNGFNVARWCEDLKDIYPELAAENFANGYDRFSALWEICRDVNQRHADVSIPLKQLHGDFDTAWGKIAECVGSPVPAASLHHLVVPPAKQDTLGRARLDQQAARVFDTVDRAGRRYARARVAWDRRAR